METEIPEPERKRFAAHVADAYTLARAGQAQTGYTCLQEALKAVIQCTQRQSWGPALVEQYRAALRYYAYVHALPLSEPPEPVRSG